MTLSRRNFFGSVLGIALASRLDYIAQFPWRNTINFQGLILPIGDIKLLTSTHELITPRVTSITPVDRTPRLDRKRVADKLLEKLDPTKDLTRVYYNSALYGDCTVTFEDIHMYQSLIVHGICMVNEVNFTRGPVHLINGDTLKITALMKDLL